MTMFPILIALALALIAIVILLIPLVLVAPFEGLSKHHPLYHGLN